MKLFSAFTLFFCVLNCLAANVPVVSSCDDRIATNSSQVSKNNHILLNVFKHYCYEDHSGSFDLFLNEKQDFVSKEGRLSSTIAAQLFKRSLTGEPIPQWSIRDLTDAREAGVYFSSTLTELADIDGDGLIEPIFVYMFIPGEKGVVNYVDDWEFTGRLKIILFYKSQKVVIRAITGTLDGTRDTRANALFFELPKKIQRHLVRKMERMYRDGTFLFDNSYNFWPRKAKD